MGAGAGEMMSVDDKTCTKCLISKPLTNFYARKDKLRAACKVCMNLYGKARHIKHKTADNERMRKHYADNVEQYQKKHAEYRRSEQGSNVAKLALERFLSTEKGRKSLKLSQEKYKENNLEKLQCHWKVNHAIRTGKLFKMPCVKCGEVVAEAHHPDYTKPLNVIWLCRKHHKELHRSVF